MSRSTKNNLLKYGISSGFGLLCVWGLLSSRGFGSLGELERLKALSDAFTIPGLLMSLFGILLWVSTQGALDGVAWATTNLFHMLIPGHGSYIESYSDYVEKRRGKEPKGFGFLLKVGLIFLALGVVFTILYLKKDPFV